MMSGAFDKHSNVLETWLLLSLGNYGGRRLPGLQAVV